MIYLINQLLLLLLHVHVHFFCPQRYYVPVFSILLKQQLVCIYYSFGNPFICYLIYSSCSCSTTTAVCVCYGGTYVLDMLVVVLQYHIPVALNIYVYLNLHLFQHLFIHPHPPCIQPWN
jgi:hypothetical protein